jgi:CRISPR-associated protein Cas5h
MPSADTLVLEVHGEWAHFRRYYTTTSPLTFPAPPRTVVIGLLGAILGIEKEENPSRFAPDRCRIAVSILNPIKTYRLKENWRQGASGPEAFATARVPVELVRDPWYRIFVQHSDNDLLARLKTYVEKGESYFTPSLGITECLAEVSFVDWVRQKDFKEGSLGPVVCASIVPRSAADPDLSTMEGQTYHLVEHTFPYVGTADRQFIHHRVLMERRGQPFPVIAKTPPFLYDEKAHFFLAEPS